MLRPPRMGNRRKSAALNSKAKLLATLIALQAFTALATTFATKPFPNFVGDAPLIVRGKVGMTYSNWGSSLDGQKQIYTFTELIVTEWIKKGDTQRPIKNLPQNRLVMRQLGGTKDGVGMKVVGSAEFSRSEEAVVFLGTKNPDDTFDVFGLSMGKFNLTKNEDGENVLVGGMFALNAAETHAHREEASHDDQAATHPEPHKKKSWTLNELKDIVNGVTVSNADPSPSTVKPFAQPMPQTTAQNPSKLENISAREPAQFESSQEVASLSGLHLLGVFLTLSLLVIGIWKLVSRSPS